MEEKQSNHDQKNTSPTIYVGDLSSKTLDSDLFRMFSSIGEVSKIKLKSREEPRASFAFVTFTNKEDAERAIKEYNNYRFHNKTIRVTNCIEDKPQKEDFNLIVKNLPPSFTSENLHDTFSVFGKIISAKIATYADGKLKNYGFVQFDKKKSAKLAIKHCNGGKIDDKVIEVEIFDKEKRTKPEEIKKLEVKKTEPKFTNCFVKNFPSDFTEKDLESLLSKYGKITSIFFPLKSDTKQSKGFAFANFDSYESACNAIADLHGKMLFTPEESSVSKKQEPFYIQKGQKKEEREEFLKKSIEQCSTELSSIKRNLYITNIPNFIEKEDIEEIFGEFGKIVSLCIGADMINDNKKYAFVCYETSSEAFIAIEKGNEIFIDNNKLNVTYFKTKEERIRDKVMSSVRVNQSIPYVYSSPIKLKNNSSANYDLLAYFGYRSSIKDKLYEIIMSVATAFKHEWENLNVNSVHEFADLIYKVIITKSDSEINEMKPYTDAVNEKVAAAIEEIKNKNNLKYYSVNSLYFVS